LRSLEIGLLEYRHSARAGSLAHFRPASWARDIEQQSKSDAERKGQLERLKKRQQA